MRDTVSWKGPIVALLALLVPAAASASTAYEAGLRQAHKRGVASAACYAKVFETHASLNPHGRWVVRAKKRDVGFQLELQSQCGVAG